MTECDICYETYGEDRAPVILACKCKKLMCTNCVKNRLDTTARCPWCDIRWSIRNFLSQCQALTPTNILETLQTKNLSEAASVDEEIVPRVEMGAGELRAYYESALQQIIKRAEEASADQIENDKQLAEEILHELEKEDENRKMISLEQDAEIAKELASQEDSVNIRLKDTTRSCLPTVVHGNKSKGVKALGVLGKNQPTIDEMLRRLRRSQEDGSSTASTGNQTLKKDKVEEKKKKSIAGADTYKYHSSWPFENCDQKRNCVFSSHQSKSVTGTSNSSSSSSTATGSSSSSPLWKRARSSISSFSSQPKLTHSPVPVISVGTQIRPKPSSGHVVSVTNSCSSSGSSLSSSSSSSYGYAGDNGDGVHLKKSNHSYDGGSCGGWSYGEDLHNENYCNNANLSYHSNSGGGCNTSGSNSSGNSSSGDRSSKDEDLHLVNENKRRDDVVLADDSPASLVKDKKKSSVPSPLLKKAAAGDTDTMMIIDESSPWSCPACTFENKPTYLMCEVCGTLQS